ncbi:MAG: hypothetical protein HC770_03125 [Pseudanabaena sp. CRU_2_10]|nr:hypothetical protein [Pseudanabaena sp. CRU_2_10]
MLDIAVTNLYGQDKGQTYVSARTAKSIPYTSKTEIGSDRPIPILLPRPLTSLALFQSQQVYDLEVLQIRPRYPKR